MNNAIRHLVEAVRSQGDRHDAAAWRAIAERASSLDDRDGRAFALRHLAAAALEERRADEALSAATEAAEIYRREDGAAGAALDRANALRLAGLAQEALGVSAGETWREARELYWRERVDAGVAECDRHLTS